MEYYIIKANDINSKCGLIKFLQSEKVETNFCHEVICIKPYTIKLVPKEQKLIKATSLDSFEGIKGKATRLLYISSIKTPLRNFVRDIKKIKIEVY